MLITTALLASVVVAVIGGLILWSNPTRTVNRVVFACSLHIAIWLGCLHIAIIAPSSVGLLWLRRSCAIGGLIPFSFWIVKESIITDLDDFGFKWLARHWGWMGASAVLLLIPFSDFFIPAASSSELRVRGWGYYAYMWSLMGLYGYMFFAAFRSSRRLTGSYRLELQIWLGGGCAMVTSVIITMALNAVTGNRLYIRIQPLLVLVFYGGIAFAITARRIFNARQILLVGLEKTALVVMVAGSAYLLDAVFDTLLPASFAFLATTAISLWLAMTFNSWLDRVFHFYPQATAARQAAFAAARGETRVEDLEQAFLQVLKGWGHSEFALLLSGTKDVLRGGEIKLSGDSVVVTTLQQLRWATPERLARERPTPERLALAGFFKKHGLGVLVIGEGPALTTLVGVGVPASRRPFTYPQVTQLTELVSIFESALERAHYSLKAQHAEQLATVGLLGASLAHEIRNPLVTIKTFVHLLPQHHGDPAFREKFFRLIGEEVSRIDRLTVQLLDLAAPRVYAAQEVPLHSVLNSSLELVTPKANDRAVRIVTEFRAAPDVVLTDPTVARQVLLNLCFNAIQAVEGHTAEPWVKVSTRRVPEGVELAVADNGPGIAPEIMPRLFQPFASTKTSGFGLGLAICSDILSGLGASITVDLPQPGCGATFRVIFPCPPPTS
jgi:signal transduction histidine kinase